MEPLLSVAHPMSPRDYLSSWDAEQQTLFLQALSESRVGARVAARLGLLGRPVQATLFGRIAMVRRVGRPALPPGAEIQVDPESLPAAEYLAAVAGGNPFTFQVRAPRYARERAVVVSVRGGEVETRTLTVSEGGASIAWPGGDPPTAGEVIGMRLTRGFLAPSTGAVVCWTAVDGPRRTVGLRVVTEGRGGRAWRAVVDEASRSGGPVV